MLPNRSDDVRPIRTESARPSCAPFALRWLQELVDGPPADPDEIAARRRLQQASRCDDDLARMGGRLPRGIGVTRLIDAPLERSGNGTCSASPGRARSLLVHRSKACSALPYRGFWRPDEVRESLLDEANCPLCGRAPLECRDSVLPRVRPTFFALLGGEGHALRISMEQNCATPAVVLVVDDEPLIRLLAADVLEEAGFKVIEAPTADDAVLVLGTRSDIRVVFTDVDLLGCLNGFELARFVQDHHDGVGVIVGSGKCRPTSSDLAPGTTFLQKPYALETLVREVRRLAT
jgi:two-component system, response regulator PdtaR